MEAEVWAEFNECATGGNLEDCKKAFDRLQLVTQHIESELMQFKNRAGEVDPLLLGGSSQRFFWLFPPRGDGASTEIASWGLATKQLVPAPSG
jgi:hypothetical protein